jgi:hypothetical protein
LLYWDMRFSAITTANAIAWAVLIGLVAVAFVLVVIWGPLGLIVLGLFTLLVCTSFNTKARPTWGIEVFKARIDSHGSPNSVPPCLKDGVPTCLRCGSSVGAALCSASPE